MKTSLFFSIIFLYNTATTSIMLAMDNSKQNSTSQNDLSEQQEPIIWPISEFLNGTRPIDTIANRIKQGEDATKALHIAAGMSVKKTDRQEQLARLLLDHNANPNAIEQGPLQANAIDKAIRSDNIAFAIVLFEHGATCGSSPFVGFQKNKANKIQVDLKALYEKNSPEPVLEYKNELIPTLQQFIPVKDVAMIVEKYLYIDLKSVTNLDLLIEFNKTRIAELAAARSKQLLAEPTSKIQAIQQ